MCVRIPEQAAVTHLDQTIHTRRQLQIVRHTDHSQFFLAIELFQQLKDLLSIV